MDEFFPVLAGIALGLATSTMQPKWLRAAAIAMLGVAIGGVAAWISGELAVSWLYVVVDTAQVVVAAVLSGVLVWRWRLRRARSVTH